MIKVNNLMFILIVVGPQLVAWLHDWRTAVLCSLSIIAYFIHNLSLVVFDEIDKKNRKEYEKLGVNQ